MSNLHQHYTNEQTGISYTLVGDYYLPDLILPKSNHYAIGRFGRMRLNYLKNHRKALYVNLLTSGKLDAHLREIDETANDRMEIISKQMAECEGVTEQLKAENQMLWVKKMNGIHSRVVEIIRDELIYD
ncbi:MAG: TnpV protein [Oscillospiraceae bacterium]|nr:TnpV protein [Oscillospiraceae bacterium]